MTTVKYWEGRGRSYPDQPLSTLAKVSDGEQLGIYRDALRTYGLWSYRSAPLIER